MPGKTLTVFVQPDDWTGDEEQWPIKKLNVTVEHLVDSVATRGTTAMRSTENDCKRLVLSGDMHLME